MNFGLLSKGYYADETNHGQFTELTQSALLNLQEDAGLVTGQIREIADGAIMKAALGVDEYKLISSGNPVIREMQQMINRDYLNYTGINPCDGVYGRNTVKAVIYALQALEMMPLDVANGNFGPSTKTCCPTLPYTGVEKTYYGQAYSNNQITSFTILAQYLLYCMGCRRGDSISKYDPKAFTGSLNTDTYNALHKFQQDYALAVKDKIDLNVWMALIVSTGNPMRPTTACDCSTILDDEKAAALKKDGNDIVGRYLTGTVKINDTTFRSKALTRSEMQSIFDNDLNLFVIFQDERQWINDHPNEELSNYFNYEQGKSDAEKAAYAAAALGVPKGEYIYFAVDYDYMDAQVTSRVIPYFQGIHAFAESGKLPYSIGIYGSRNICSRVADENLSTSSFVSDMSTGFSGNLGYPLPEDWAFDQIREYNFYYSGGSFAVDNVVSSGRYSGFHSFEEPAPYGSVQNPVTKEVYPIKYYENGKEYLEPEYEEEVNDSQSKPTHLIKNSFNWPQFISGLEFNDEWKDSNIGALTGTLIGGIMSAVESIESVNVDIFYFKEKNSASRKAVIKCGNLAYENLFQEYADGIPHSLKLLQSDAFSKALVDKYAKEAYEDYTGTKLDNLSYSFDIEITYDKIRSGSKHISYLFLGADKIELIVKYLGMPYDTIDITKKLNVLRELPKEVCDLFTII